MKRKTTFLTLLISGMMMFGGVAYADDDVNISYNELPQTAKTFIEKNFGANPATKDVEYENASGAYSVELRNGYDFKFDSAGKLIEIDSPDRGEIAQSIVEQVLPAKAVAYLKTAKLIGNVDEIDVLRDGGYKVEVEKTVMGFKTAERYLWFDKDGKMYKSQDVK